MRILVAEDNSNKIQRIRSCVESVEGVQADQVVYVQSVFDAKEKLRSIAFDLLILDVLLPNRAGDTPSHSGTVGLLEELATRNSLQKPRHVLGLTAFDEAIKEAGPAFVSRTWAVIKFSFEDDDWCGQVKSAISYIVDAKNRRQVKDYGVDLCIITALHSPEFEAVTRLDWKWGAIEPLDDQQFVRRGTFVSNGETMSVVAASATKMGMVSAALLAAKLIEHERPRFLVMAGICAGVQGKANYGDVVVSDPAWDWQSGKHIVGDGGQNFAIAPDPVPIPQYIRSRFEQTRGNSAALAAIKAKFPKTPDNELRVKIGPMASGAAVLADKDVLDRIITQNRNLVAVEMEAFGVVAASLSACRPRPTAFAVKSVCDFADDTKDDSWQAYAAYTSAEVIKLFFESYGYELREQAGSR